MAVRRTARRHGLHTDASHRFERGADFNAGPVASALVSRILLANGGSIEGDLVDVRVPALEARTAERKPIALALSEVQRILGTTIDKEGITAATVESVLGGLGCGLKEAGAARLAGYAAKLAARSRARDRPHRRSRARSTATTVSPTRCPRLVKACVRCPGPKANLAVRRTMLAAGFHEAIGSTFCSAADAALTAPQPGLVVPLGNPLSEEAGVLRPSLVPGMLTMIAGNLHRDVSDVRLFELGTVFSGTTDKVEERPALAFGAVGSVPEQSALHPVRAIEFHDVKGAVEQVLGRFQSGSVYFDRFPAEAGLTPRWLHPYRSARVVVDGLTAGWFGQLHPREAAARKLKDAVFLGELYLDRLYRLPLRKPVAREISRFQPVRRDFSLVLDESVGWERIDQAICRSRYSRTGRMAGSRSVSRCKTRRARILAAAGSHVPGAGPHAARRGFAGLSRACHRGRWQSRCAAQDVIWCMVSRRYTGTNSGGLWMSELPWAPEVAEQNETDHQAEHPVGEPGTFGAEPGRFFFSRRPDPAGREPGEAGTAGPDRRRGARCAGRSQAQRADRRRAINCRKK